MNCAVLTGATSDLGKELAYALAQKSSRLLLTARSLEALQHLKNSLKNTQATVDLLAIDLLIEKERQTLIAWMERFAPDLLINSAGIGLYGECLSHPIKEQMDILTLNAHVPLELSLHAAKALLKEKKRGTILNISSATDQLIYPTFSVYASSKSFLTHVSKSLDYELAPYGIRVLASAPGPIATQFRAHASKGYATRLDPGALSCKQATQEILRQIERQERYHPFPLKVRVGRFLLNMLPESWRVKLLRRFLKPYYSRETILSYDQDISP